VESAGVGVVRVKHVDTSLLEDIVDSAEVLFRALRGVLSQHHQEVLSLIILLADCGVLLSLCQESDDQLELAFIHGVLHRTHVVIAIV